MSPNKALSVPEVVEYVKSIPGLFSSQVNLTGSEIGDGNMNFVFRITEQQLPRHSVIVKQALPYMRSVGATWPLTANRIRVEYEALKLQHEICPDLVPKAYHFDADLLLIVMEDLESHTILRNQLISHVHYSQFAPQIGMFLARTLFFTSCLVTSEAEMESRREKFKNQDMVQITSDFVFTFPFMDHEMNRYNPAIRRAAYDLWSNSRVQDEVVALKRKFNSEPQALLHGDLHTGSIMVTKNDTKVIDPEFAFFGPMGFDIGTLIANLLLNYCGCQVHVRSGCQSSESYQRYLLKTIEMIWEHLEAEFRNLWMKHCDHDANDKEHVLTALLEDSIGFAGCEIIRRVTGTSHVLDLEHIEDENKRAVGEVLALRLGQQMILERSGVRRIQDVTRSVRQVEQGFRLD